MVDLERREAEHWSKTFPIKELSIIQEPPCWNEISCPTVLHVQFSIPLTLI